MSNDPLEPREFTDMSDSPLNNGYYERDPDDLILNFSDDEPDENNEDE